MFTLLAHLRIPELLRREFVPFSLALGTAEAFYHFGSFSLECGTFLLTWWIFGKAADACRGE